MQHQQNVLQEFLWQIDVFDLAHREAQYYQLKLNTNSVYMRNAVFSSSEFCSACKHSGQPRAK